MTDSKTFGLSNCSDGVAISQNVGGCGWSSSGWRRAGKMGTHLWAEGGDPRLGRAMGEWVHRLPPAEGAEGRHPTRSCEGAALRVGLWSTPVPVRSPASKG